MSNTNNHFDRQLDRTNWFCCVSNLPEQMAQLEQSCKQFKRWFYIRHIPDSEEGKDHIHVMVMYGGSCRIKTAASLLGIPENMVQPCHNHNSYGRYLIHKDDPDKHQYSISDVKTNFPGLYKSMLQDSANDDINSLFIDIREYQRGIISLDEFVERHFYELQNLPIYQKIKIYEYLEKCSVRTT